jgi:hypothetical protein
MANPGARFAMSKPGQRAFAIVDHNMLALLIGTNRELAHPADLVLLLKRIARSELAAKPSRANGGDGNLAALQCNQSFTAKRFKRDVIHANLGCTGGLSAELGCLVAASRSGS